MRKPLVPVAVLLSACSTAPAATIPHRDAGDRQCRSNGSNDFVGEPATSATGSAILRASHAALIRWGAPGRMLTMDYRSDRVTVWYGPDGKITKVNCG